MDVKVKVPYKLEEDKSEIALIISVEGEMGGKGMRWSVQLAGEGIDYLNYWCRNFKDGKWGYDNSVIQFLIYEDFIDFLKGVKEDIKSAWENYNNESKHMELAFEDVKEMFEPLLWKEE